MYLRTSEFHLAQLKPQPQSLKSLAEKELPASLPYDESISACKTRIRADTSATAQDFCQVPTSVRGSEDTFIYSMKMGMG